MGCDLVAVLLQLQLDRVIGLTSTQHHALAVHPVNGYAVYAAGYLCIVYDPKTNTQVRARPAEVFAAF